VLGIWIAGIIGLEGQPPPITYSPVGTQAPVLGYPVPVRADGTLSLPLVPPIQVKGLTLEQAEEAIRKAYVPDVIQPKNARIVVTLQRPRQYQVLVIRQDSADLTGGTRAAGHQPRRGLCGRLWRQRPARRPQGPGLLPATARLRERRAQRPGADRRLPRHRRGQRDHHRARDFFPATWRRPT